MADDRMRDDPCAMPAYLARLLARELGTRVGYAGRAREGRTLERFVAEGVKIERESAVAGSVRGAQEEPEDGTPAYAHDDVRVYYHGRPVLVRARDEPQVYVPGPWERTLDEYAKRLRRPEPPLAAPQLRAGTSRRRSR